jgi:outer membrane protein assembly factor BamB
MTLAALMSAACAWAGTALVVPRAPEPVPAHRVLWERTVSFPGRGLLTGSAADLDGDGLCEIVLHSGRREERSHVAALEGAAGRELWRAAFPQRSCAVPCDMDADGAAEVVVACGEELVVLDGATGKRKGEAALMARIGDLVRTRAEVSPGAAGPVLIYTGGPKRDDVLVALGSGLEELWSREAGDGKGPFARGFTYPCAMDVDGDGRVEVVVAENGNHLVCLSEAGELVWDVGLGRAERLKPEGVISCAPVAADFFGDGATELAVGCLAGAVAVIDPVRGDVLDRAQFGVESHEAHLTNEKIPRFIRNVLSETGEPVNCLTPAELDGDPGYELAVGCSDGFLYAYDPGSGEVMWRFDTLGEVYDPCLRVVGRSGRTGDAGASGATDDLLAWDEKGIYLLDGETGVPRQAFGDVGGAGGGLACDLTGTAAAEFIRLAPVGGAVTAWMFTAAGPAASAATGGQAPESR